MTDAKCLWAGTWQERECAAKECPVHGTKLVPGMYGVTWSNDQESVCQTGYVYASIEDAERAGRAGPRAAIEAGIVVDDMTDSENTNVIYAHVQTEDETISTVRVGS